MARAAGRRKSGNLAEHRGRIVIRTSDGCGFDPPEPRAAVVLCVLSVALELPMAVEIAMIAGALVLLASAGGLIGAAAVARKT